MHSRGACACFLPAAAKLFRRYREFHVLANLGWVDFD